jgi:hypothetical protein
MVELISFDAARLNIIFLFSYISMFSVSDIDNFPNPLFQIDLNIERNNEDLEKINLLNMEKRKDLSRCWSP